jgi:hypothetical protein
MADGNLFPDPTKFATLCAAEVKAELRIEAAKP